MRVRIEAQGIPDLRRLLIEMREEADNRLRRVVYKYSLKIQTSARRNIRQHHAIDTGRLRNSIGIDLKKKGLIAEIGSDLKYAPYVEFGTAPHWPPIDALRLWAKRHGIDPFLVARAIARRGLRPRPFLTPALEENRNDFIREVRRILSEIAG